VLNVPPTLLSEVRSSFALCALSIPAVLFSSSVVGLLQAAQRFDLTTAVQLPVSTAQYLIPLLCAFWWPSLPAIVAVLVVTRWLSLGCLFWLAMRVFPGLLQHRRPDWMAICPLIGFGGWLTLSAVVSPLLVYADRFLVGSLLTISAVAYYSVPSDAVMRLLLVPSSLVTVLFPVFSRIGGVGDGLGLRVLLARAEKFILYFFGLPVTFLLVCAPDLLRLWMGQEFAAQSSLGLQMLLFGVIANALAYIPSSLIQAMGRADITAKLQLAELPIHFIAAFLCIRAWGVPGAAAAWSVRTSIDATLLFVIARRLTGACATSSVRTRMPTMAVTLLMLGVIGSVFARMPAAMPLRMAFIMPLFAIGAFLLWRRIFDTNDRATLLRGLAPGWR
jgi:O-antigen/teichoic acid export membrane protein